MKMSLRRFILINLLFGELLAITLGVTTTLFLEREDVQTHIDNKLLESVFTVQTFLRQPDALEQLRHFDESLKSLSATLPTPLYQDTEDYSESSLFNFYIWDTHGNILFGSENLIPEYFYQAPLGFSQTIYNDKVWRAFSTIDPATKTTIMALQQTDLHKISPRNLAREVIVVMLTSYFFLGLLMWFVLARALRVLQKISTQVQQQGPDNLTPIDFSHLPVEIRPIVEEWNKLFSRLNFAFDREKRFAADAAHELKTPLAALKTHTQLALHAKNESELINALHKIVTGVNRSAHVVQQLLTLSRMSQGVITEPTTPVDVAKQAKEIIADLVPQALEKETEIELIALSDAIIEAHETAITILIRNLVDNAVRYSPEHSLVQVVIEESPDKQNILLKVIDNGPGIPEHLRERVFERFFRVIGNKTSGSGLGLGIVQQIADLHHAVISLETPLSGHGLQVTVMLPKVFDSSAL
jgi:two-component system sensor histidine kinase QseC